MNIDLTHFKDDIYQIVITNTEGKSQSVRLVKVSK